MTELPKLIKDTINELVPVSEEREAILQAIKLQEKFGSGKSINLLSEYEKIIEGLVK